MVIKRLWPILLISLLPLVSCASPADANDMATAIPKTIATGEVSEVATAWPPVPPESCPVTKPPDPPFVPPHPNETYPYTGYVWYGTPELWTDIPVDGRWYALPFTPGKGFGQKVVFWTKSLDWQTEIQPELTLTGRRLDKEALVFATDRANSGYHDLLGGFIMTGADIPTPGCWEMTAIYQDAVLMFVVWVAP